MKMKTTRRQRYKARKAAKRVTIASLFTSHWINGRTCIICGPVYREHDMDHPPGQSATITVIDDPFPTR